MSKKTQYEENSLRQIKYLFPKYYTQKPDLLIKTFMTHIIEEMMC